SVVGLVEVLKKYGEIKAAFNTLKKLLTTEDFDLVVLIDYPDFNLRFASEALGLGVPVLYYISPQVWAWRKGRVKEIARVVDKLLVVFPFEVELYKNTDLDVEFVGHPLAETTHLGLSSAEAKKKLGIDENKTLLAILPGSRTEEVKRLLRPMVAGAMLFRETLKEDTVIILPVASSIDDELIHSLLGEVASTIKIVRDKTYLALNAADIAVVASGTATLETALFETPMVIVYSLSPISFFISSKLVEIDTVGLPNIIAGKKIVPELLQSEVTPENIFKELSKLFDKENYTEVRSNLGKLREKLGEGSASKNAAKAIFTLLDKNKSGKETTPPLSEQTL
ncbi:MAG: lipid-A-disaccharide synthase, partial [Deltaproteobacteria bacterium]|nr:lipid-A-disaccharide synthase [Deltaproteobacteria bacterium]